MTNRIELKFEKANTRLAGNDYGREIYIAQVKDKVNYDDIIYIVFPDQIVNIASSFVQGFFEEIVKKVGKLGIGTRVVVIAKNVDVEKVIISNLV